MTKEPNPLWFNVLSFSMNLFIYSIPLWIGFMIYNRYGAEPIAQLAFIGYVLYLGSHMVFVVKSLIKSEVM